MLIREDWEAAVKKGKIFVYWHSAIYHMVQIYGLFYYQIFKNMNYSYWIVFSRDGCGDLSSLVIMK